MPIVPIVWLGFAHAVPAWRKHPVMAALPTHLLWVCWLWKPDFPFARSPLVPGPQSQRSRFSFGTHQAPDIIVALAVHFSTISHNDASRCCAVFAFQLGPSGNHLVVSLQEVLTPPHMLSQMEVWLSSQVATFRGEGAAPVPHSPPVGPATEVHSSPVPSAFAPFPHNVHLSPTVSPRSPFASKCKPTRLSMVQSSPTHLRFLDPQHLPTVPRHFLVLDPFVSPDSWRCHATSVMPL